MSVQRGSGDAASAPGAGGSLPSRVVGLAMPRLRPDRVRRARLVERLERGASGRLVVVDAPAGFGKTTLIADWLAATQRPHAWLTVERGFEAPDAFLACLAAAVDRALGIESGGAQAATREGILLSIASRIADSGYGLVVVVDDFHRAETEGAGDIAARLSELMPEGSCLVVAGRSAPRFPTARLRAKGELEEIGADELRFTSAEARELLSRASLPRLSDEDASVLEARTEGWVAGLQLALLALRDGRDPRAFVEAFGGTTRSVYDFLTEEAIDSLAPATLAFLVTVSVADSFCPSLADVLVAARRGIIGVEAGDDGADGPPRGAADLLAGLERDCLFLAPLDDERCWYRLHTLFREALISRLRAGHPGLERELRRAASLWLEQNGRPAEALRQAALAGDATRTAALSEGFALAALERGDIGEMRAALAALPEAEASMGPSAAGGPWLRLAAAWAAAYAGSLGEAKAAADAASAMAGAAPAEERRRIEGHAEAVRAYAAWQAAESRTAVELARRALDLLPEGDAMARGHAEMTLGGASYLLARDGDARDALRRAMDLAGGGGILHVRCLAAACLASQSLSLGDLDGAKALCVAMAAESGAADLPALGDVLIALSRVHWERGEIGEALEAARRGLELCLRWGHADSLVTAYIALAEALAAAGESDSAIALLGRAKRLEQVSTWHKLNLDEAAASIEILRGNWRAAQTFCANPQPIGTFEGNFTQASYLIARKKPSEALPLLDYCRERCERRGLATRRVETYVLYALARRARGERQAALDAMRIAVLEASPMGASLRFLRRGAAALELLEELREERRDAFVEGLVDALRESLSRGARAEGSLSPREIEILRLIAEGRTAFEAADRLCVAPSTVRSHVKSIYSKLGAHRRIEAIRRAKEIGLL